MPTEEALLTGFVSSLAAVEQLMADKSRELRRSAQAVDREIEFGYMTFGAPGPDESRRLAITGYVEAQSRTGDDWACWTFRIVRDGAGWTVSRSLESGPGGNLETEQAFAEVETADSAQLGDELATLISELLDVPSRVVPA